ncbi:MAG: phosphoribosylformylglycinamidine cyclo-ligase [Candidatus Veblenbacteria bacterium]|nr:phosphoribosylformylglycinamidine cyclo-ligase [Candidatus Veblenbacteria bacterium]
MALDYKSAGVDIDADSESVRRIKDVVKTTHDARVVAGLGTFGALYDMAELKNYRRPVLVQSIDGVGTKVKIATLAGRYASLGEDIVNHSCNDVVCQGARPLTFLDYIASFKTEPAIIEEIVSGMAQACRTAGVALIGGETAEMSTVYAPHERDIAGCITGVVEHERIITGAGIAPSDVVLGLASSGLHTNGFSLVRKVFFENSEPYIINHAFPELSRPLGEELLAPHRNYSPAVLKVLEHHKLKGLAHITGGGLIENPIRILPQGTALELVRGSWPVLPIFGLIQKLGGVDEHEMYRAFNMGLGMLVVVAAAEAEKVAQAFTELGEQVYVVGKVIKGDQRVAFV